MTIPTETPDPTDAPSVAPRADPKAELKAQIAAETEVLRQALVAVTPNVYMTWVLLAACVGVYALMVAQGVKPMEPTVVSLVDWGANYGPRTTNGEWWRLASSMFVHGGALHLAFNMIVLAQIGIFTERLFGNFGFVAVYFVAGLGGSLARTFVGPDVASVGASGAIFGLYGALLGFLLLHRSAIPKKALSQLMQGAAVFVGYNVVFGLGHKEIDQAAHLGGLAGGFLCGLAMPSPFTPEGAASRTMRGLVVLAVGLLATAGAMTRAPASVDFDAEIRQFAEDEKAVLATYNAIVDKAQKGQISDAVFADSIERDVLPKWTSCLDHIAGLQHLTKRQAEVRDGLLDYMKARSVAWNLYVEAGRTGDMDKVEAAKAAAARAEAKIKDLTARFGEGTGN